MFYIFVKKKAIKQLLCWTIQEIILDSFLMDDKVESVFGDSDQLKFGFRIRFRFRFFNEPTFAES
jgi:hypothetical protein